MPALKISFPLGFAVLFCRATNHIPSIFFDKMYELNAL